MVVGVLVVGLQQVVIDVLGAQLRLHRIEAQGLEFEHCHRPGGVLQQGMVDANGDLLAGHQLAGHEVVFQYFVRQVHGHTIRSSWVI